MAATLSIVIPVYNKRELLPEVVRRIDSIRFPAELTPEIIIVDDGSTDGTTQMLQLLSNNRPDLIIQFHTTNLGKGAALRTGFAHATGDMVLIQEANLDYDVRDYRRLFDPVLNGNADVVCGTRFFGQTHRVFNYRRYMGTRLLNLLSNLFTNLNLTDMTCSYKLFRREVIKYLKLRENRKGFEAEVIARVSRMNVRICEAPVRYTPPAVRGRKRLFWKEGLSALRCILRYNLFPGPVTNVGRLLALSDTHTAQAELLENREAA